MNLKFICLFDFSDLFLFLFLSLFLQVREDDSFPKRICRDCEESVNTFYNFRENCCRAYFTLIQSIGVCKDPLNEFRSESTQVSETPEPVKRFTSKRDIDLRNVEEHSTSIDKSKTILPLLKRKVNVGDNEDKKNSSVDFDLERNIPEHHIMCLDTNSDSKAIEESDISSFKEKNRIQDSNIETEASLRSKEDSESFQKGEQGFDSREEKNSLNGYNLDSGCYQVEEIQEQILCDNYIKQRVKYRCLRCDNNFDDLDSITAHYNEYCQTVDASAQASNGVETGSSYLSTFQYLEENFHMRNKETENLEYLNNEEEREDADFTNHPQLCEFRRINDLVEIDRDNVVENDEQNSCIDQKNILSNNEPNNFNRKSNSDSINSNLYESDDVKTKTKNFQNSKSVARSFGTEENLNDSSSKPRMINFARVRKKKGNWSEKTNHPCPNCDRIFVSGSLLKRHSMIHTGEKPHVCEICNRRFAQLGQLNFHRKFHNNPRYRCHVCSKPFLRPSDIKKHLRTHTGEKPYDCKVCLKSFAQLGALQQHMRIHSGEKPFSCEICGKRFSQKANKTKHVKIHREGERPYTCQICGRSFSDLSEMELHRAGHGGGKPRKCDHCQDSFRKLSELNHHVRRFHTFEKQHKCMFCSKEFYSICNLKQHVMVHTGQRPHACSKCDLKFTQKGNLTKHFERKHSEFVEKKINNYIIDEEKSSGEKNVLFIQEENVSEDASDDQLIVEREETIQLETDPDLLTKNRVEFSKRIVF